MPIYEYHCPKCKEQFELKRPMSEADKPAVCPKCGSQSEKLISGFAAKTGSYVQGVTKPFRKEAIRQQIAQPTDSERRAMNGKHNKKPKKTPAEKKAAKAEKKAKKP